MKYSGRTATAIIIYPQNKILLIRRSTPPFVDYWALPGGRAEQDEPAEQTVVREVKEETGLNVKVIRKVGEYREQGVQAGLEYDYHPACFFVRVVAGEIQRQEKEIAEIKLFSLDGLPEVLAFEHGKMIKDFLTQSHLEKT